MPGVAMGAEVGPPLILVCRERPNAWNKGTTGGIYARFGRELTQAFDRAGRPSFEGPLYGVIYWFVRDYGSKHPDADNISKPVWDMLGERGRGVQAHEVRLAAYKDDKQVRLRLAGIAVFSLTQEDTPEAELNALPRAILPLLSDQDVDKLDEFIEGRSQHFTYVECGFLRPDMFVSALVGGVP